MEGRHIKELVNIISISLCDVLKIRGYFVTQVRKERGRSLALMQIEYIGHRFGDMKLVESV